MRARLLVLTLFIFVLIALVVRGYLPTAKKTVSGNISDCDAVLFAGVFDG